MARGDRSARESVSSVVSRLRFVSTSAPALYLNEPLVREMFVAQLGSIHSFTRSAGREAQGEAGLSVVKIGGSRTADEQVEYSLDDPLAQALVVHSALGSEGAVTPASRTTPVGAFVEAIGPAYLPALPLPRPDAFTGLNDVMDALDAERSLQQQVVAAFGNGQTTLQLLALMTATGLCASVIDWAHVRAGLAASYLTRPDGEPPQIAFGLLERVVMDVPLLTLLYLRPFT